MFLREYRVIYSLKYYSYKVLNTEFIENRELTPVPPPLAKDLVSDLKFILNIGAILKLIIIGIREALSKTLYRNVNLRFTTVYYNLLMDCIIHIYNYKKLKKFYRFIQNKSECNFIS